MAYKSDSLGDYFSCLASFNADTHRRVWRYRYFYRGGVMGDRKSTFAIEHRIEIVGNYNKNGYVKETDQRL